MARYVIPSVTIPAIYTACRNYFYPSTDETPKIRTIESAISALNENTHVDEALRYLRRYKNEHSSLSQLSPSSSGMLALRGAEICKYIPVFKVETGIFDKFEDILAKFDLGDEWNTALAWINRVACPEEDLACADEWLVRRPSQIERLYQLLQILFLKTEKQFDINSVSMDVIPFLYNVYCEFREINKDMGILALKTLSNIALNSMEYAKAIFTSEWLALLSQLVDHGETIEERLISHKVCQNALNALGVVDYHLCSDIYELYLPEKEAEVDVVLIHGLRGSIGYTWRQNDSASNIVTECWPKDWLPLDIPQPMRILGIDYPSYILQFTGTIESLQDRADRFKHQLTAAGVGKKPVVFICHSMGGLLAKRILLDLPEMAENTVGIMFIATPHKGSPIASWGISDIGVSQDVLLLREPNKFNKQLNEDFGNITDKIPVIVSMVETKESNLIGTAKGIVVPTQSAVFEKGAVYHIEEVHHNVCKPSERSSANYSVVLNFLRDCLQEACKRRA